MEKLFYKIILVYGAMVDINCGSVDWLGNALYQIDPGSKPRACLSDLEESAVGGSINYLVVQSVEFPDS